MSALLGADVTYSDWSLALITEGAKLITDKRSSRGRQMRAKCRIRNVVLYPAAAAAAADAVCHL